jgi:hypothetical protein
VGSTAGTGDDHLEALVARASGKIDQPVDRAMCRNDAGIIGDVEGVKRVGGILHGFPVGLAAHDDGDGRGCCFRHVVRSALLQGRRSGRSVRSVSLADTHGFRR